MRKKMIALTASIGLVMFLFTVTSCDKSDDDPKDPNESRGMTAGNSGELVTRLSKDYAGGTVDESLLAASVDYNAFQDFLSQVYSCAILMSNELSEESYQKQFGNSRVLQDNQFCHRIMSVRMSNGKYYSCSPSGVIVIECNSKTGKYYIIEYTLYTGTN
ncbi:MAG: hypothetical protein LBV72_15320 [Tannerella sp.]|nr:hypothetical protein [Tannerella sp.]